MMMMPEPKNETPTQRKQRLQRKRREYRRRLANETPEQRTKRLAQCVIRDRTRRSRETPAQRTRRHAHERSCRLITRIVAATYPRRNPDAPETEQERKQRLKRQNVLRRIIRALGLPPYPTTILPPEIREGVTPRLDTIKSRMVDEYISKYTNSQEAQRKHNHTLDTQCKTACPTCGHQYVIIDREEYGCIIRHKSCPTCEQEDDADEEMD